MFLVFVIMIVLTIGCLCLISFYLLWGKREITQKGFNTQRIKPEDTHGNIQIYIYIYIYERLRHPSYMHF